ncbi:MAG TPA: hypothetical protein ENN67_06310 [Firmicutes bacterium]|nr:hypothetical protein [Bacillota bacterium]
MSNKKKSFLSYSAIAMALLVILAGVVLGQSSSNATPAMKFRLVVESPGGESSSFAGAVLNDYLRLKGSVAGIETAMIKAGDGEIYILTPAIRTARKLENPDVPDSESADWSEWLIEPARVNPFTFAGLIGKDSKIDGQVRFGAGNRIDSRFSDGVLQTLSFPSPSGDGTIKYTYSDFVEDAELKRSDFDIPEGFIVTE